MAKHDKRGVSRGHCLVCGGTVIDSGGNLKSAGNQTSTRWEGTAVNGNWYHYECADAEARYFGKPVPRD